MPTDFTEDVSEENICKALCLTGMNVVPDDLHACHRMKYWTEPKSNSNVASKNILLSINAKIWATNLRNLLT